MRQSRLRALAFSSAIHRRGFRRRMIAFCVAIWSGAAGGAAAETMASALAQAYAGNPDLNRQRANVLARDEDVPKAAAGMMPKIGASVNGGPQVNRLRQPAGRDRFGERAYTSEQVFGEPYGGAIGVTQSIFDGWRTENSVRQAESGVFAARSEVRLTEQETLQNGATVYMDVLRDTAVLSLRKNDISVLKEQLRVTRDRQELGDVTSTDVAQAQAALARAETEFFTAQATLEISVANYRRIIGIEPRHLEPASAIEHLLPSSVEQAVAIALVEHPAVVAALHQVDAADLGVKIGEGALLPTLSANVRVSQQYDSYLGIPGTRQFTAQVSGTLNVPIYQGGGEYASVRQAKAQSGQARWNADMQRDSVRANVASSFARLKAARSSIVSSRAAVKAAELALRGVRDEAQFGQRTTLDVLNAQQALLNARVDLVSAQRNQVVASYAALGAVGRLSAATLRLETAIYDPTLHFEQTRGKWIGLDAPNAPQAGSRGGASR